MQIILGGKRSAVTAVDLESGRSGGRDLRGRPDSINSLCKEVGRGWGRGRGRRVRVRVMKMNHYPLEN